MFSRLVLRVASGVAVILGVVTLTFLLLHLAPGNPAVHLAGPAATPEQLQAIRTELGLNRPLFNQFADWLGRTLR